MGFKKVFISLLFLMYHMNGRNNEKIQLHQQLNALKKDKEMNLLSYKYVFSVFISTQNPSKPGNVSLSKPLNLKHLESCLKSRLIEHLLTSSSISQLDYFTLELLPGIISFQIIIAFSQKQLVIHLMEFFDSSIHWQQMLISFQCDEFEDIEILKPKRNLLSSASDSDLSEDRDNKQKHSSQMSTKFILNQLKQLQPLQPQVMISDDIDNNNNDQSSSQSRRRPKVQKGVKRKSMISSNSMMSIDQRMSESGSIREYTNNALNTMGYIDNNNLETDCHEYIQLLFMTWVIIGILATFCIISCMFAIWSRINHSKMTDKALKLAFKLKSLK